MTHCAPPRPPTLHTRPRFPRMRIADPMVETVDDCSWACRSHVSVKPREDQDHIQHICSHRIIDCQQLQPGRTDALSTPPQPTRPNRPNRRFARTRCKAGIRILRVTICDGLCTLMHLLPVRRHGSDMALAKGNGFWRNKRREIRDGERAHRLRTRRAEIGLVGLHRRQGASLPLVCSLDNTALYIAVRRMPRGPAPAASTLPLEVRSTSIVVDAIARFLLCCSRLSWRGAREAPALHRDKYPAGSRSQPFAPIVPTLSLIFRPRTASASPRFPLLLFPLDFDPFQPSHPLVTTREPCPSHEDPSLSLSFSCAAPHSYHLAPRYEQPAPRVDNPHSSRCRNLL